MLDGFPQGDFVLWVFMCVGTNVSLFCDHLYCTGYHAEGYHAPSLPPRAITPVYTSRLSHQSYHAPPHTYIGLSIYIARAITPRAITPLPPLPGCHAEGYHAPSLPPRAITPVYTSRLSHQSYHALPHTYIACQNPTPDVRVWWSVIALV